MPFRYCQSFFSMVNSNRLHTYINIASVIVTYGSGYLNAIQLNESTFQSPHQTYKKEKKLLFYK